MPPSDKPSDPTLPSPDPTGDADLSTLQAAEPTLSPPAESTVDATPPTPSLPSKAQAAPMPEIELPKELTDRFEIVRTLGRGGMGVVYLGRDKRLERQVAIKLMLGTSGEMISRFEDEGKLLAALEHDHVVRLYDYGWAGHSPYLVMEFVRGEPLSAKLAAGRPPVLESARIACDILEGVLAAHRQGITHRDLKPANVFLEESGRAKVADFGVAARRRAGEGDVAEIIGTPGYMAPEQARGQPTGPAADVYAVGVILHQMLTGQRLWTGNSLKQIVDSQLGTCPVPPSRVNPSVPAILNDVVERALAIEPRARPSTTEFLAIVRGWYDRARRTSREPGAAGFPASPYKQLEHFGPDDAVIFYGRQAESMELVDAISAHGVRMLSIFGPCGIGKSSLVHAGLIPALTRGRHDVITLVSGPDPARALRETVAAQVTARGIKLPDGQPITAAALALNPDLLTWTMVELARTAQRPQVLVLDQLEELFTQNPSGSPNVSAIFELLVRLTESQVSGVKTVLSYRSEFHAQFFPLEERLSRYKRSYLVRQITAEGLEEAIAGPTEIEFYNFRYEAGLPARIAKDILEASKAGDTPLPVMQIICSHLYERMKRAGGTAIDARAYAELGGVDGALARYVEERLDGPSYASGGMARQMLKSLTVREEGRERFSRARDEAEVLAFNDQRAARATLERLVSDHLVVRTPARDGGASVRLASEVICKLVDGWELEPDATERAYRLLTKNHRQWVDGGRRDEDLVAGGALSMIEAHLPELSEVTPDERAFVAASRTAHDRRRRERVLGFAAALALVLVMAYLSFLRPGSLGLTSVPPGAEVFLDGRSLGRTPLDWSARPGVYRFAMKLPRHHDAQEVVQLSAGGSAITTTVMQYRYGLLQVASAPLGATCTARTTAAPDVVIGTWTTPVTTEVLPGDYILELTSPGHLPARIAPVEVGPNRQLTARSATLVRNSGWLSVQCPFEGVEMDLLDAAGRIVWESTLPLKVPQELPVGHYTMRASRPGSVTYTHGVDVTLGTTASYTAWVPPVRVLWRFATGPTASSPAVADLDGDRVPDVVVGADDGHVHAVSGRTGLGLWSFAAGDVVASSPALADLTGDGTPDVVVGVADGAVHALSGADGRALWTFRAQARVESSPALADLDGDGTPDVAIGSKDNRVYALSGRTGRPLWTFETAGDVRSSPALADLDGDGTPDVVVGSKDRKLHAISGKSGRALWAFATGGWVASPALADLDRDGVADAVVGSSDNRVYAVSGRTGKQLWSFVTGSLVAWAAALGDLNGDGVADAVTGSTDRHVYALDGRTGAALWRHQVGGPVRSAVVLDDMDSDGVPDAVLGSSDGHVHALSGIDGATLWDHDAGGWVNSPALADFVGNGSPEVVISSRAGELRVLATRAGTTAWAHETRGAIRTRPLLIPGNHRLPTCVVASEDGEVTALSGTTGLSKWTAAAGAAPSAPLASIDADGRGALDVLVPRADGAVRALEGDGGAIRWTATGPGPVRALAALGTRVAVARPDGVHVLDARTGATAWLWKRPHVSAVVAVPAPATGLPELLVVHGNALAALRVDTEKPLWELASGDRLAEPGVADVTGDGRPEVVVGSADRRVRALDLATGAARWATDTLAPVGSAPAFADVNGDGSSDVVIGSAYRALHMLSGVDGSLLWQVDAGGPTADAPRLVNIDGTTFHDPVIGTTDRRVRVLAGRDGRGLLDLHVGQPLEAGPVVGPSPTQGDPYVRIFAVHDGRMLMLTRVRWPYRHVEPRSFTHGRSHLPEKP